MKIIIVGAGIAGTLLIESLSGEGHDIVLIEKSEDTITEVTDKYNVTGIVGSGASLGTLERAGASNADMLIALTAIDEVNLLSCLQAKTLGTRKTVARLLLQDLSNEQNKLKEQYAIDYIICPKIDAARLIAQNTGLSGNVKMEGYFEDLIQILSVYIDNRSPLVDKALRDIRTEASNNLLVAAVVRRGRLIIPDGKFVCEPGDNMYFVADTRKLKQAFKEVGVSKSEGKRVFIVGGGITCEYLTGMLLDENKVIHILENNINNCRKIMEQYPNVDVSYGDGESIDVLEEENVEKMDVVVSLTDKDETNLIVCLFAWAKGVPSIITRVESPAHAKLLHKVNMDITVSPAEVTINKIMRYIRNYEIGGKVNEIHRFYSICDGLAEIMEFSVTSACKKTGIEFKSPEFKLKKDTLVAAIIRGSEVIIPGGSSMLCEGDKVVVVSAKKNHLLILNDMFDK